MDACNRLNLEGPLACGPRGESLNEPALRQQRGEYNRGFTRDLRVTGVGNSTNVRGIAVLVNNNRHTKEGTDGAE